MTERDFTVHIRIGRDQRRNRVERYFHVCWGRLYFRIGGAE